MTRDGQAVFQDFYFKHGTSWASGNMSVLASEAKASFLAEYPALFTNEVAFVRVVATDLTSLASERAVEPFAAGVVGEAVGGAAANNVALSIQKQTGNRGKGKQGRIMWGPIPAANMTANQVSSVYAALVIAAMDALVAAVIAEFPTAQHVVLSRWDNGVWRTEGIGIPVLNIGYSNLYVDSMKDRLPQHKRRRITSPAP
jgi:hypothetical protein